MRKIATLLTVLFLFTALDARANLITNGSFETPLVPPGAFTNFAGGSTLITGWTVQGPEVSVVSGTFTQSGFSFPAEDGAQWVDLTGFNANNPADGLTQTVATTAGTHYNLSFWVGNVSGGIFGTQSAVLLTINGANVGEFVNVNPGTTQNWAQFQFSFTASSSSTTIGFFNGDPSSDNDNGLDNVDLEVANVATPEPASLFLLGSGLIGLVGFARRRRS